MPPDAHQLSTVDLVVLMVYILGIVAFGAMFAKRSRTLEGFTVGSRSLPGWAVGLSILGTFASSIAFLANPGKSYATNWNPFVFGLSLPIACIVSSLIFIPLYRNKLQTTAYEHLENRFGYWARAFCGISLILLQLARIGVVLYLVSLAMAALLGWDVRVVIVVLGILTIFYTAVGGIEAVIWTDVVQAIVLLGGGALCCVILLMRLPEGAGAGLASAWDQGKFSMGSFSFDFGRDSDKALGVFWVVFVYGIWENVRNFGVDQNYVQRFIAAKSDREAHKSLWLGGILFIPVSALFFLVGTLLFIYYLSGTPAGFPADAPDKIFPFFIQQELPIGLRGLVLAALLAAAMSTLDSSMNVSATVFVVDFFKRFRPDAGDKQLLNLTRVSTVIAGVIGGTISFALLKEKTILDTWWKMAGIIGGGMVGIFLLGLWVKRASSTSALIATACGAAVIAWGTFTNDDSAFPFPLHDLMIGPAGTVTILAVGWFSSMMIDREEAPR